MVRTTARSWLTQITAVSVCSESSAISSRIVAWTETSSAEVTSSQSRSDGRAAKARASATRWRCPPESSAG